MASRAQQKRQRAETEAVRAKEKLTAELELRFEQGHAAGVSAERNVVRRAFIHAYKPKTSLPTIPAGHTRLFWISVRLHERDLYPTQNRMVHWADVEGAVPERAIGAPAYQRVTTNEGDLLAMMGVVYKLDSQASAW
ncbi:MAG: hypothetical protein JWL75_708 [Parcubacteria group bacterium]|nr:hypothetical protein [Parcubacteria group bacterium]